VRGAAAVGRAPPAFPIHLLCSAAGCTTAVSTAGHRLHLHSA
jgi:hypothetical protein